MADSIEKKLASLRAEIESVSTEAMGYRTCDPNRAYAVKENMLCIIDSISRALSPAGGGEDDCEVLDAAEALMRWCVKNVQKWHLPEYDRLHAACERKRAMLAASPQQSSAGDDWVMVPRGLLERVKAAEDRVNAGHCIRRIPADQTDPDLVLCEVRLWLEGQDPPCWIKPAASPQQEPGAVEPKCHDCFGHGILLDADITCPRCNGSGKACGGCGETDENKRCIGCQHVFTPPSPSGQTLAGAGGVLGEIDSLWSLIQEARVSYSGDHASGTFRICGDRLSKIRDSVATLTATSAGTTGDDSARLDWLLSRIPDTVLLFHGAAVDEGWPDKSPSRKGIDAARRAREVGK